jgi:hypothetical protein
MGGALAVEPWYFELWALDEVDGLNRAYRIAEALPNLLPFGTTGGGEILAFDPIGQIVMVPFIPMREEDAIVVASSWSAFAEKIIE